MSRVEFEGDDLWPQPSTGTRREPEPVVEGLLRRGLLARATVLGRLMLI
jgi:hypothetical protein